MTKRLMAMVAVGLAAVPAPDLALAQDRAAHGTWRTPDRGGLIEISTCDGGLCGKVVGGDPNTPAAQQIDRNNKNPALRGRPILGIYVFRGLKPSGKTWTGSIYNPEDGGTYKATATLKSANEMSVRGCIVWPLCKTQVWTRVK